MRTMSKKLKIMLFAACMTVMMCIPALAADATVITASDWQPILDAITPQISVTTIVAVLATMVSAVIGLVFMWWGIRKALKVFFSAFRKGKASV